MDAANMNDLNDAKTPGGRRRKPAAGRAAGRNAPRSAGQRRLHVLIVDDDALVRSVVARHLTGQGHTVTTAANGREGLAVFRAGQFDLVLTDRNMPEMNGDHLAAAIREISPRMPIVMLTAYRTSAEASGDHPAAVDLVLTKPLEPALLQKVLARAALDVAGS